MVRENPQTRRPVLTLDDLALPVTRRPERLHALTAAELTIGLSQALDLAEGKPVGHAQKVCYIATSIADAMEVEADDRAGAYFAYCQLHLEKTSPLACALLSRDTHGSFEGSDFEPVVMVVLSGSQS